MKSNYALPITIVLAGLFIAGAIFVVGSKGTTGPKGPTTSDTTPVPAVTANDHIFGNPQATVFVIEYMDFECPHCKIFHNTMHAIMDAYGSSGTVAWIQRPFPLVQIHSKAPTEAQAAECAAELGGNDAYWKYADRLFEVTPGDNNLDLSKLPEIAVEIGLDKNQFESCLTSGKYTQTVQKGYEDAVAAGAQGTPYIVITTVSGGSLTLEGAQPFASMKDAIDSMLGSTNTAAQQ